MSPNSVVNKMLNYRRHLERGNTIFDINYLEYVKGGTKNDTNPNSATIFSKDCLNRVCPMSALFDEYEIIYQKLNISIRELMTADKVFYGWRSQFSFSFVIFFQIIEGSLSSVIFFVNLN